MGNKCPKCGKEAVEFNRLFHSDTNETLVYLCNVCFEKYLEEHKSQQN